MSDKTNTDSLLESFKRESGGRILLEKAKTAITNLTEGITPLNLHKSQKDAINIRDEIVQFLDDGTYVSLGEEIQMLKTMLAEKDQSLADLTAVLEEVNRTKGVLVAECSRLSEKLAAKGVM